MNGNVRQNLLNLNDLAKDIYGADWRISDALEKYSFSSEQISALKTEGLEDLLQYIDFALKNRLLAGLNGVRFFKIIYRRYGLFGHIKETLQSIGESMGVSRERVRQLEVKALRRLKPSKTYDAFEIIIVTSACQVLNIDLLEKTSTNEDVYDECDDAVAVEPSTAKREPKIPFSLTPEQQAKIPYSAEPLAISTFISGLNGMRKDPTQMAKLSYMEVTDWLLEKGYLEVVPSLKEHGRTKAPTEKGRALGISWEKRHSEAKGEDYMVALYDAAAQRFVVENLPDIIASGDR